MRSTLCALLVVALVGFAATAGAYDFLYTGEKTATHDAGSFGLDIGLWYFMADKAFVKAVMDKQDYLETKWAASAQVKGLKDPKKVLAEFRAEITKVK